MSVSLVPLIYLNRSDLRVARSANVARYQPYPYPGDTCRSLNAEPAYAVHGDHISDGRLLRC
jgi:hypothetical protein